MALGWSQRAAPLFGGQHFEKSRLGVQEQRLAGIDLVDDAGERQVDGDHAAVRENWRWVENAVSKFQELEQAAVDRVTSGAPAATGA